MKFVGAALLVVSLGACGKEKAPPPSNEPPRKVVPGSLPELGRVCDKSFVYTDVPPVDKGTPSTVSVQGIYLDEKEPTYRPHQPTELRGVLANQFDLDKIRLVLCVEARQTDESLKFQGITVRGVTYKLRLIEIGTGKTLEARELSLSPLAMNFGQGKDAQAGIPAGINVPTYAFAAFAMIAPYQPATVTPPDQPGTQARLACGGTPLPGAAAFTPGTPAKMRVVYVGLNGHFHTIPPAPIPTTPIEDDSLHLKDIALVVCARAKPGATTIQTCKYDGLNVDVKDGAVDLDVIEARTGTRIATKSFASKPGKCPGVWGTRDAATGFVDVGAEAKVFLDSVAKGTPAP